MEEKVKNIELKYIIYILIFFQLIYIISSSSICESSAPFIKNNECVIRCTTDEIKSKICVIDPQHSKYCFTNLIVLGEKNNHYINLKSNINNDFIIQISNYNGTNERIFYGLKNNGRYLFKANNQEIFPYMKFDIIGEETEYEKKFDGESAFIQLSNSDSSNNEEECFINIGKGDQYTELFDFEEKEYNYIKTEELLSNEIYSDRYTIIKLSKENDDDKNYYLIVTINKYDNDKYQINMKKIYFSSKILKNGYYIESSEYKNCSENKMISCFQTKLNKIICFYRDINEEDESNYYYIVVYECCFSEIKSNNIARSESSNVFYKGIHLKEEIGVFGYFTEESTSITLSFKYFDSESSDIENYKSYDNIKITQGQLNYNIMLNDLLKISDTKICFTSASFYKSELYIIILTLYKEDEKMSINYYLQPFRDINNYYIYNKLSLSLYNNQFITLGVSICFYIPDIDLRCNDDDEHYASLILFSYPNSTDVDIHLIQLLYETNEKINEISFNLEEYTFIENNLFNYVFKGIKIINIPENIKLISTINNIEIDKNKTLSKNESFTLSFSSNDIYDINNYTIEYALILTEADYYESMKHIMFIDPSYIDNEKDYFVHNTYIGKTSYYNIKIEKKLITDCLDNSNCSLCLSTNKNYCITCEGEYYFEENKKICKENNNSLSQSNIPLDTSSSISSPQKPNVPLNISSSSFLNSQKSNSFPTSYISNFINSSNTIYSSKPIYSTNIINSIYSRKSLYSTYSIYSSNPIYSTNYKYSTNLSYSSNIKNDDYSSNYINSTNTYYSINTSFPSTFINYSTSFPSFSPSSFISLETTNKNIISSYFQISNFTSSSLLSSQFSDIIDKNECTKEQILENKCKEGKITNEQIENIHDYLKENLINNKFDDNSKKQIIETENAVFQLSTLEEQKNNIKPNISSVDLGKCEYIIKQNILGLSEDDELVILKTDISLPDEFGTLLTYVQFELFNPYTLEEIDLVICDKSEISISVPVYLNHEIEEMNEKLNISGYNIFDQNDSFYNDICSKYTTENGTDITLNDRRNYIYKVVNNVSLCQDGCNFQYYDSRLKRAKCNCAIQEEVSFINDIKNIKNFFKSDESLLDIFSETLSFSNFFILTCYKLLLNYKDIIKNYGCIIISIIFIIFIIFMLKFFIKDNKDISKFIKVIIEQKFHLYNLSENNSLIKDNNKTINNIEKNKFKGKIIIQKIKKKLRNQKKNGPPIKKTKKSKKYSRKFSDNTKTNRKLLNANILFVKDLVINKNTNIESYYNGSRSKMNSSRNKNIMKKLNKKKSNFRVSLNNVNKNKIKNNNNQKLNVEELNSLKYSDALKLDNRSYCQYYYSLLLKKHLLLFAFVPTNDYNIVSLKICLLLIIFSLYFAVNGFFF